MPVEITPGQPGRGRITQLPEASSPRVVAADGRRGGVLEASPHSRSSSLVGRLERSYQGGSSVADRVDRFS